MMAFMTLLPNRAHFRSLHLRRLRLSFSKVSRPPDPVASEESISLDSSLSLSRSSSSAPVGAQTRFAKRYGPAP